MNIDLFIAQQTACQELLNEISDIARQERIVIERYHASEKVCLFFVDFDVNEIYFNEIE